MLNETLRESGQSPNDIRTEHAPFKHPASDTLSALRASYAYLSRARSSGMRKKPPRAVYGKSSNSAASGQGDTTGNAPSDASLSSPSLSVSAPAALARLVEDGGLKGSLASVLGDSDAYAALTSNYVSSSCTSPVSERDSLKVHATTSTLVGADTDDVSQPGRRGRQKP